jgi:cell wall assembly regulator SMI1
VEEVEDGNDEIRPEIVTDPKVKRVWYDPAWVSFARDIGGNRILLDFDPLPGGTVGQVLLEDHDEAPVRPVLAPNFRTWLNSIVSDLESGRLVWNEELTGYCFPEDL